MAYNNKVLVYHHNHRAEGDSVIKKRLAEVTKRELKDILNKSTTVST